MAQSLPLAQARKRLGAIVERVARGGAAVAIGRYGRERAVLIGAEEYASLKRKAQRRSSGTASIEGTLKLTCSPAELAAESRRIGELWLAALGEPADVRRPKRARRR